MKGPRIYNVLSDEERIARLKRKAEQHIKEVHRVRKNKIYATFAVIILFLGISLARSLSVSHKINTQVQSSKQQLAQVSQTNKELTDKKTDLNDPDYVAKLIRYKFYYSKKGETIYNIPEKSDEN